MKGGVWFDKSSVSYHQDRRREFRHDAASVTQQSADRCRKIGSRAF